LVLLLTVADDLAYPHLSRFGGRSFNTGANGLWLRYWWYVGKRNNDLCQLAQLLREKQIRYAYFHVGDVKKDGALRFRYPANAWHLVHVLHREAPSVEVIAWIYAGNSRGKGEVNLSNTNVRKKMMDEALWLVNKCGFDGVQWDYEICGDGDPDFLKLMRETRAAFDGAKQLKSRDASPLLSAAVPMWLPHPLRRWGWSHDYFAQVAATCDQMAVMCYDSGFYLPRSYVWLVRQQAIHVAQSAARGNPNCRVLLGVPTYGKGGASHHPHAENIRLALKGVREGLSNSRADLSAFAGVAIFADYTTQSDEWQTYQRWWLEKR
jgi:hypothetical protein